MQPETEPCQTLPHLIFHKRHTTSPLAGHCGIASSHYVRTVHLPSPHSPPTMSLTQAYLFKPNAHVNTHFISAISPTGQEHAIEFFVSEYMIVQLLKIILIKHGHTPAYPTTATQNTRTRLPYNHITYHALHSHQEPSLTISRLTS